MNKWWTLLLLVVFVLILPACQEATKAINVPQSVGADPIPEVIGDPDDPPPPLDDEELEPPSADEEASYNLEVAPISLWSDWSQNYHHCLRFLPSFFGQTKKSLLCFYQIAVIIPPPQHRLISAEAQQEILQVRWSSSIESTSRPWGNLRLFRHLHFLEFETAIDKTQNRILWIKHSRLLVLPDSDGNLRFIRYTIE